MWISNACWSFLVGSILVLSSAGNSRGAPVLSLNEEPAQELHADPWIVGNADKRQAVGYDFAADEFLATSVVADSKQDGWPTTSPTLPPLPDDEYAKDTSETSRPNTSQVTDPQEKEKEKPKNRQLKNPKKSQSDPSLSAKEKEVIQQLDRPYKVHGEGKDKVVWIAAPKKKYDKDGKRIFDKSKNKEDAEDKKRDDDTSGQRESSRKEDDDDELFPNKDDEKYGGHSRKGSKSRD